MAARAIHAVGTLVAVVLGVAAKTGDRGLRHFGRLHMTGGTSRSAVRAAQGKAGHFFVVETGLLPPSRIMTRRAVRAVLALVRIITRVTPDAGAAGMLVRVSGTVATSASGLGVAPYQRKAGTRMIKGC